MVERQAHMMTWPAIIQQYLVGYTTAGDNLRTASESEVFRYTRPDGRTRYLKTQSTTTWSAPLSNEADAMRWLHSRIAVPNVVTYTTDRETEYLLTDGIPGMSSETESCHDDKARLVEMLASVFIDLHVLPIDDCPIDRGPEQLLARGRKRVETGIVTQQMVDDQGLSGSPSEALQELVHRMPSTSKLVFTHGDYCLPNVMIQEGRVSGLIDLGYAGISDAYRDFVAADYSIARNLGREWVEPFFEAYGSGPLDPEKMQWYRQIQAFH